MAPSTFRGLDRRFRTVVVLIVASFFSTLAYALLHAEQSAATSLPNNFPQRNPGGYGATFSSQGEVDLTGEYFQPQGSNGRSCATCHLPEEAWAITPGTLQRLFDQTGGMHPIFNRLDSNNEALPVGSVAERLAAYSMLLSRGVFRRGGTPRAGSEWELIAVDDPHGFANLNRLVHWRRVMPTINFALGSATVNWDGGNSVGSDQHAGLINQATRNVVGAQQGSAAPPEVIADIVAFEESLFTGQLIVLGVGRLDDDGARGGPEALSTMTRRPGRFDLFDAWLASENPRRAQIARGQELFNTRGCGSCHDSANNGTNTSNRLFDIGTASAAVRTPDLPLYTFRHRTTLEIRQLTDAGRGNITGLWADLGKFKTPTLRGLAARAPCFHNGIALTLESVVRFYEDHLGFVFSDAERADLVAFLNAL